MSRCASLVFPFAILFGPGCDLLPEDELGGAVKISKGDIASVSRTREALTHFAHRYVIAIQGAAATIVDKAEDVESRRKAVLWQIFAAEQGRDAVFQHDILASLVDVWILCIQMREFFDAGGAGHDVFGAQTPIALEAAKELEADIDRVCTAILPEGPVKGIRDSVQSFAREHPIRLPFARDADVSFLHQTESEGGLNWMYHTSLAPLRAIGGMDDTAVAILKLSDVASRTNVIASYLPNDARLQSQLLLYTPDVQGALASVKMMAESASRMSETAQKLPAELSEQIGRTFEELGKNQKDIGELLASLTTFVSGLQTASVDVEKAGVALTGTTHAIHNMVNDLRGEGESKDGEAPRVAKIQPTVAADPSSEAPPFNVNDYGSAAKEIAAAAAQLTSATAEVKSLVNSDMPAVVTATGEIEGLVNRVALFGVLLIVAFFGGLIGYRVVAVRLARGSPESSRG